LGGCLVGASLMFIPQALVHNVWQLFAARFGLGIFMGGLLPTVNALIGKYAPMGMESRAYSFNTSALSLGNMTGPVVGGAISGLLTIQQIFIISSVLLMVNAFWSYKTLLLPMRRLPKAVD
jgi:DHA1 family multidrug resistance protein-like MFS transporter